MPTQRRQLLSPSSDRQTFAGAFGDWVAIVDSPVSVPGPHSAVSEAFVAALRIANNDTARFMEESTYYVEACKVLPTFGRSLTSSPIGNAEARTFFTPACGSTMLWDLPQHCMPELRIGSIGTGLPTLPIIPPGAGENANVDYHAESRQYAPGINGEIKTAGDKHAFMQVVMYSFMDMVRVFFPATKNGTVPAPPTYFDKPPIAYGLLAFPHVAYWISIEMIGRLLIAPASAPFFMGSTEHKLSTAALPDVVYSNPLVLAASDEGWESKGVVTTNDMHHVGWTVRAVNGRFYKRVRGNAYSADFFRSMYVAYGLINVLLQREDRPSALVSDVTLRFGAHEVLVDMPFVEGRHVTNEEFVSERVVKCVAEAVAWLARNKIVYRDVRNANVLITDAGDVFLVDYDDCFVVDNAIDDYAAYAAALKAKQELDPFVAAVGPLVATFSSELLRGTLSEVRMAFEAAFESLRAVDIYRNSVTVAGQP